VVNDCVYSLCSLLTDCCCRVSNTVEENYETVKDNYEVVSTGLSGSDCVAVTAIALRNQVRHCSYCARLGTSIELQTISLLPLRSIMSGFSDFMSICYQSEPPKPSPRKAKRTVVGTAHTIEETLVYRESREEAKKKLRNKR